MKKLTILLSGAAGYVLGTRAGHERYEQIRGVAAKVKDNPTVQDKAQKAAEAAKAQAPAVVDKLSGAAETARAKVSRGNGSEFPDESLINERDPYPQGDLP